MKHIKDESERIMERWKRESGRDTDSNVGPESPESPSECTPVFRVFISKEVEAPERGKRRRIELEGRRRQLGRQSTKTQLEETQVGQTPLPFLPSPVPLSHTRRLT